jgi:cytoskeleton protein RodZ
MSKTQEIVPRLNPPTETTGSTESLGAWLARTRASHGAEPREMARHLGLNPTIILALEADDFARLGPPVFVRGYLSLYARLLKLPEAAVLERYRQQSGPAQEPPPLKVVHLGLRQTRIRDLRGLLYLLVVIGIGWTAVRHLGDLDPGQWLAWWPQSEQTKAQPSASKPVAGASQTQHPFQSAPAETTRESAAPPAAPAASEPPLPSPEPTSISASAIALSSPPASAPAPGSVAPAAVSATVAPTPGLVTPEAVSVPAAPVSATLEDGGVSLVSDVPAGARLVLQFSEDCWVQVKDVEGKVLLNGLMKADTTHAISGSAPFTVTLGNAPAARIALDDRPIDTAVYLPRRGTVSRFTLNAQP